MQRDAERERNAHVALAAGFVFFLFSQVSERPLRQVLPLSSSFPLPSGSKKKKKEQQPDPQIARATFAVFVREEHTNIRTNI